MRIEKNISLAQYTTLRVGGLADFFTRAESEEDLLEALNFAKEKDLSIFVLSGGSNILFSDKGLRGLVIKNEIQKLEFDAEDVLVGNAVSLAKLVNESIQRNLAGLEKFAGIPGTVGGAIVGNANEIGEMVESVEVISFFGEKKTLKKEALNFEYRNSNLKNSDNILISAKLNLKKSDQDLRKIATEYVVEKSKKHPAKGTAGSWFKNPSSVLDKTEEGQAPHQKRAWELIDEVGCRGLQVGQVIVSEVHANFFQNLGNAKTSDFLELEKIVKQKVLDKFGINLEREVIVVGEKGALM